jgi:hypothetical protein
MEDEQQVERKCDAFSGYRYPPWGARRLQDQQAAIGRNLTPIAQPQPYLRLVGGDIYDEPMRSRLGGDGQVSRLERYTLGSGGASRPSGSGERSRPQKLATSHIHVAFLSIGILHRAALARGRQDWDRGAFSGRTVAKGRAREARWRSMPPHIESRDHVVDWMFQEGCGR